MFSTTQKLWLAYAVQFHGISNESSIKMFMSSRSISIDLTNWKEIYKNILEESQNNGYSNPIEYCEDVRYKKMVDLLDEKIKLRDAIREKKIDMKSEEIMNYMNFKRTWVHKQDVSKEEIQAYYDTNIRTKNGENEKVIRKQEIRKIPKAIDYVKVTHAEPEKKEEDLEKKIVKEDSNPKMNKNYYVRMNEEEREFDDYLDKVEDYYYTNTDFNETAEENEQLDNFPILGKVKTKEERDKLVYKEMPKRAEIKKEEERVEDEILVRKYRKTSSLEEQYKSIFEKVTGRKKVEKDKNMWIVEIKTVLKIIQIKCDLTGNEYAKVLSSKMKETQSEIKKETILTTSIFKILLDIQEACFRIDDDNILKFLWEFKKSVCAFYDFYRK